MKAQTPQDDGFHHRGQQTPKLVQVVLHLSPSQQMALVDLIAHYMTMPGAMREFIDCSNRVTTTPGDLLFLATWGDVDLRKR